MLATGLLASTSPSRVATHAQCDAFPTSSPMTIPAFSVVPWWYPPIVRPIGSPPRDTHIARPWRPRPAVSYQSFGAASASGGNTPPALFGAGTDGHPEAPDRRPLGACPYRRQCAECSPLKFIGGLSQTVMGWRIDRAINGRNRPAYPLGQRERAIQLLDGIGLMDYEGINGLT